MQESTREIRRQRAVESLGVIDSDRNPRLDRITRMARAIFGVPMSSVTVLDNQRALFLGRDGFDVPVVGRHDTPCHLVIDSGEIISAEDAAADARFDHIEPFRANGLGFYLGHPLLDGSGNVVGSFCVMGFEPRHLDAEQMSEFEDLAAWAQSELLADAEAASASATQQALLPAEPLEIDDVHVEGVCLPSLSVGGDYFDYGVVGRQVHVAVGDVMGKGVGAAILGSSVRAACRAAVPTVSDNRLLGTAVDRIERAVIGDLQRTGSFVTYFHAVLDLDTDELSYVDAGSGLALVVRADGSVEQLMGSDLPLGLEAQTHETHTIVLLPGDRLVVMSDGVLDVLDDENGWLAEVGGIVARSGDAERSDAPDLVDAIALLARDRIARDDVTLLVLDRRP
ncbi:SpoIIE family protein phosphatase [Frigoribacterium sp. CFBP9039]|uniref:SpoIIE family protein phosphatase n=1 Tax=Frigoribacterium sp. CFBP9029 TaxID=3096541 RepID=UPI002A6A767C|nr:SpoIIE family protein phosphatase [Frigoribacterium sp. CFBP9039]MDY0947081.1 SpoIIE family protein phosphatase [Frigoribacterium sp. CFBP9039]